MTDLTTEAFLAALTRMVGRRGRVHEIYSDNATTFHGADNELVKIVNSWKEAANHPKVASQLIKWSFITPYAPHHGRLWEAAVKSAKFHLRRVVGPHQLTYEELTTLLVQVEACLNSRPITAISDDHTEPFALTPGHFIIGEPLITLPVHDVVDVPVVDVPPKNARRFLATVA